jgi:hypothetical protein
MNREALTDGERRRVQRLTEKKASEYEVGMLRAWARSTADVGDQRLLDEALAFQETAK